MRSIEQLQLCQAGRTQGGGAQSGIALRMLAECSLCGLSTQCIPLKCTMFATDSMLHCSRVSSRTAGYALPFIPAQPARYPPVL